MHCAGCACRLPLCDYYDLIYWPLGSFLLVGPLTEGVGALDEGVHAADADDAHHNEADTAD